MKSRSFSPCLAIVFMQMMFVLLISNSAGAVTPVSGLIKQNTTWSGDIHVTGDVVVEQNVTLTILPGTIVKFGTNGKTYDCWAYLFPGEPQPSDWGTQLWLVVMGRLVAEGTANNFITFTSDAGSPQKGDWSCILFHQITGDSSLQYCTVEYGDDAINTAGDGDSNYTIKIHNNIIRNNREAILLAATGNADIQYNTIYDNNEGVDYHKSMEGFCKNITLNNNIIVSNRDIGVNNSSRGCTYVTSYNDVWDNGLNYDQGYGDPVESPIVNTSDISVDPQFVQDPIDMHLRITSPCLTASDQAGRIGAYDALPDDNPPFLTQTEVSQLYVCIFGRASEGEGNSYWQTDPASTSLTVTANIMLDTPTAKAYFGDTMANNYEFVKHVYLNTFGKTYIDDPTGIDYWTRELDAGKSKGELIHAIITAVQDPLNNDSGQARFFNRVEVSNYCAEKLYYFTDDATFTRFLSSVTEYAASVTLAKSIIDTEVPDPYCDSNNLDLCNAEGSCLPAGGYWYNNRCNSSPDQGIGTVTSAGQVWMDRNLGASRVAISPTDSEAYGDLYQWGRLSDGHEKRTSPITSTPSSSDVPGHNSFIVSPYNEDWNDWRISKNNNLWQGVSGTNNPCPAGFRLPTAAEWKIEESSWTLYGLAGAFASPLKLVAAGERKGNNGTFYGNGTMGTYWSSTLDQTYYTDGTTAFLFDTNFHTRFSPARTDGFSVRCIKDAAEPVVCDSSHLNLCTAAGSCYTAGGYWYDNICNNIPAASNLDPVAYYPFNGNANDASGNSNHGTVNGATLTEDRNGTPNSAYFFDGNDYIQVLHNALLDMGKIGESWTVAGWFKSAAPGSHSIHIFEKRSEGSGGFSLHAYLQNNDSYQFGVNGGNGGEIRSSTSMNDGNWHSFAVIVDRDNNAILSYLDGEFVGQNDYGYDDYSNTSNIWFGRSIYYPSAGQATYWYGALDDFVIYNRALNSQEVAELTTD